MNTGKWLMMGLLALNLGLGGALWMRSGGHAAFAQGRGRGASYLVVSGHANDTSTIFIFDAQSGRLAVGELDYDKQPAFKQKAIVSVEADFKRVVGGGK